MKIVSIANNLTLNHLPGGLLVKSFTLIRSLVPGSWADFMVIPGRRATFMHCSRASAALVQASNAPGRRKISFLKLPSLKPLARSMWFWNVKNKHTICLRKFTGKDAINPITGSLKLQYFKSCSPKEIRKYLQMGFRDH